METGVDKVEFQAPGDKILGAGLSDNQALFFSNNHGIVCMKESKSTTEPVADISMSESIREETSIQEVPDIIYNIECFHSIAQYESI